MKITYQPIIIVGAARSGTNMLRDLLTSIDGFATWPCDEINYIWRHGYRDYPNDEFSPEMATREIFSFIHSKFAYIAKKYCVKNVVEKTCANSLRVGFVRRLFPNAKYIFLVRDGRDAAASSRKRWFASIDLKYLAKKARFIPVKDVPYYAGRFVTNRLYKLLSRQGNLAFWGPRFRDMDEYVVNHSLIEVCAKQWSRSVEKSYQEFLKTPVNLHQIRYEDFVSNPLPEIKNMLNFLEINLTGEKTENLAKKVSTKSVGKWISDLTELELKKIDPILAPSMAKYGYI